MKRFNVMIILACCGLLSALIFCSEILPTEPESPKIFPNRPKIAFSSDIVEGHVIYAMNTDGTNVTRLTNDKGASWALAWSPDASMIAYVGNSSGIYIMNSDGSQQRLITDFSYIDATYSVDPALSWSNSGLQIIFALTISAPSPIFRSNNNESKEDLIDHKAIYSINSDGSHMTKLVDIDIGRFNQASHSFHGLSPDGKRVLFTALGDYNREIFVMDIDGTNVKKLTDNKRYNNHPSWSFDGSKIAFVSSIDGNGIYIMDSDGNNRIKIVNDDPEESHLSYPSWSPDGSKIVYITKKGGDYSINSVNVDGSNQTQLYSEGIWRIISLAWTPQLFNETQ